MYSDPTLHMESRILVQLCRLAGAQAVTCQTCLFLSNAFVFIFTLQILGNFRQRISSFSPPFYETLHTKAHLPIVPHTLFFVEDIKELDKDRIMRLVSSKGIDVFKSQASKTSQQDKNDTIYLRYILCGEDLFSADILESCIEDIEHTTPLKKILSIICNDAKITADEVIELYSSEGYPLHSNELTNAGERDPPLRDFIY